MPDGAYEHGCRMEAQGVSGMIIFVRWKPVINNFH